MKSFNKPKVFFLGEYMTYGRLIKETEPIFADGHTKVNFIIKNPNSIIGKQDVKGINPNLFIPIKIMQGGEVVDRGIIYLQDVYGNEFSKVVNSRYQERIDTLEMENTILSNKISAQKEQILKITADFERVNAERQEFYKKWRTTAGGFNQEREV